MKKTASEERLSRIELCYTDTGGTFTDAFLVDSNGDFIIGKAPTTPDSLSKGYFNAISVAARQRGLSLSDLFSQVKVVGYGCTTSTNMLINRSGVKVGVILTKGWEQVMLIGRGVQSWVGYTIADMIHARTHRRDEPLVPYSLTKGVTERINSSGKVVIPLYEHEVREKALELMERGVDAIAVSFLFSWLNACHEERAREIINSVAKELGKNIHVYISSEVCPVIRELSHLNTTVIEAYVSEPVKRELRKLEVQLKEYGYKGSVQIMQAAGGSATIATVKAVATVGSGPSSGVMGGLYIGELYGFDNIITTDVGGTSFDVGLVTSGMVSLAREPIINRMITGLPQVQVNSIGAGGGTHILLDPTSGRLNVGPTSAQAVPGPVCYDIGGKIPTVTDCDLVLGYLDPDYFLGGTSGLRINKDKAEQALRKQIADPLGMSIADVALGVKEIIDSQMRDAILGMIMSRGYDSSEYHLLVYGGAGPNHCAGFVKDIPLAGVLVLPYAAVFCAFGAAATDYRHNYFHSRNIIVPPRADAETIKSLVYKPINEGWQSLENTAYRDMEQEGFRKDQVKFTHLAMVRYGRQLDDLIITSPVTRVKTMRDFEELITTFEEMYTKVYASAAKYPQAGYEILQVGLIATVPKVKPKIKRHRLAGSEAPRKAIKGKRDCYFNHAWLTTDIYDWDALRPGNSINGPAILESPTTNFVLPPGKSTYIDVYRTCWLK